MRAVVYDRYSENLDDLEVREVDEPKVSPASVLIEVRAAGVNPVDWKVMAGYLDPIMPVQFPIIPGWDVSGVVIGVGMDTPEFQIGDEVMAYARKDVVGGGTFAERVAVPVHAVAPHADCQGSADERRPDPAARPEHLRARPGDRRRPRR